MLNQMIRLGPLSAWNAEKLRGYCQTLVHTLVSTSRKFHCTHKAEIEKATETAQEYCKQQGYSDDTSIVTVKSGAEPELFQANFLGWSDAKKPAFVDPYEAKLQALAAQVAAFTSQVVKVAQVPADPSSSSLVLVRVRDRHTCKHMPGRIK